MSHSFQPPIILDFKNLRGTFGSSQQRPTSKRQAGASAAVAAAGILAPATHDLPRSGDTCQEQ